MCNKVYKTTQGHARHKKTKHDCPETSKQTSQPVTAEKLIHPLELKKIIQKCAEKLAEDDCYPQMIQDEFKNYSLDINDVLHTFSLIKTNILQYNGNQDKFLPRFYKVVSEEIEIFKNLSRNCCLLLGFEVANLILAHLNGALQMEATGSIADVRTKFSDKERGVIAYLSGHVFGEIYKRIRKSKKWENLKHQQYLSLLDAGKASEQMIASNSDYNFTTTKNRGGLWLVNPTVISMFLSAEAVFRMKTQGHQRKIDTNVIIDVLMKDIAVRATISDLRCNAKLEVAKEVSKNLVEDLLSLFVRIRSFSYAKDMCELHKGNRAKQRSLRKEIKKTTSSLDMGH